MRLAEQSIRLGRPHCCVCAQAEGGICGHVGPAMICDDHLSNPFGREQVAEGSPARWPR